MVLALQLCPFSSAMEQELAARLELVRWFELSDGKRDSLLAERAGEVRVVVTGGHVGCNAELMQRLPGLSLVAINGVGFDKVPLALARERGVTVSNTPGVLTEDVADLAVGLIIALKRRIPAGDAHIRAGDWPGGERPLGNKVSGSRFGILGYGRIGAAIADRLQAFGEIGYFSREPKAVAHTHFATPHALAEWCDVLVVACAANAETANLVDAGLLAALGSHGCLVNISRGSVVDEAALVAALDSGIVAGAALDVFAAEPDVPEALRHSTRTVLTPHIASATVETRAAMAELVLANIDAVLAGRPAVSPVG